MFFKLISLIRFRRKSGQSYMLIRNNIWLSFVPAMFLFAGFSRFLPHLIFDIPTPLFALHNELKYPNFLKTLLLSPAKYLARQSEYTLVYSDDQSPEVLLGTKSHDLQKPSYCLLGNWSTDVSIPDVSQSTSCARNSLRLVLMARLATWHGADLLVDAMHRLVPQYSITLTILSQTSTLRQVSSRVSELSLENQVKIIVNPSDVLLKQYLLNSDVAIGTLAPHRIQLYSLTPIKHRDYMQSGLPVICSFSDPELDQSPFAEFSLGFSENDSQISAKLCEKLITIHNNLISVPSKHSLQSFALNNLSVHAKAIKLCSYLGIDL